MWLYEKGGQRKYTILHVNLCQPLQYRNGHANETLAGNVNFSHLGFVL